eukprot:754296-Amorphochlora_amoeboformis.AAC.1
MSRICPVDVISQLARLAHALRGEPWSLGVCHVCGVDQGRERSLQPRAVDNSLANQALAQAWGSFRHGDVDKYRSSWVRGESELGGRALKV